ncbi:DNA repair exonuclease [Sporolactobacillus shoreicorticis]|uniref:Exonuclease SbcCD subunit D n=1 Tax=Sporolactobacillus shoreicorticis TaxID=1923877 RepID=A0ABW5RY78_9BACL|nr:DNA repair exonuclease [Sporolactobacillus shoreicorticis]MCO7124950.1 DNA repair exonuclease [Sporolactobacillus shoreicorticis]
MIRFIHAADLHLDRPFDGLTQLPEPLRRRSAESTFTAFTHLINAALHERPDFMIIAGDIFDNSHRSIKAQRLFVREMSRLHEASIPVYLVYGNHDFVNTSWGHLSLPDNVHVFSKTPSVMSQICSGGQRVNLYGFSYYQRWIKQDMIPYYEKSGNADYHIAVLHGEPHSGTDESNYAPFSISELGKQEFQYWALGHIHKRQQLVSSVPAWYPGDIQGLSFKESELGPKGASLVELAPHGVQVQFLITSDIEWRCDEFDFSEAVTAGQLEAAINGFKERERRKQAAAFIRLRFSFTDCGVQNSEIEALVQELVEALNEDEKELKDFIWLVSDACTFRSRWDKQEILNSPHFLGDLFRYIENEQSVKQATETLYAHHSARRYLERPSKKDKEWIRSKSEQLLAEALTRISMDKQE